MISFLVLMQLCCKFYPLVKKLKISQQKMYQTRGIFSIADDKDLDFDWDVIC